MAGENRRVSAASAAHAQGLTDNLLKQGFVLESQTTAEWVLRKQRRRGDHVVTIAVTPASTIQPPPVPPTPPAPPAGWAPPTA